MSSSHKYVTRLAAKLKPIVYYNPWHTFHVSGHMHPECPQRIAGIIDALDTFLKADTIDIQTFHHEVFIPFAADPEKDPDPWVSEKGDNYRTRYTDSILEISRTMLRTAVSDICTEGKRCAYVLTRPPGHHASAGIESGFCFENNVWTAVEALLARGKRRISIYDWDVHHGDGTERCFRAALARDPAKYDDIRFVSSHAYGRGIYPGTGAASEDKHILNLPFKKGTGVGEFLEAFAKKTLPFVSSCEVLIVSAGYDGHREDPMKLMNLETTTYSIMSRYFMDLGVPVLFILEGGYNPKILGECVRETLLQWL